MNPVADDERVALQLCVAQSIRSVVAAERFPVSLAGIIRNVKIILAVLRVQAQLIFRRLIADE